MKFKQIFGKVLEKIPDSAKQKAQMTLISTVVCIVLTASGASVETCQAVHDLFNAAQAVQGA